MTINATPVAALGTSRSRRPDGLLLKVELIQQRRLELGMSLRRLSTLLGTGMSTSVLLALEAGRNHPDLTLGEVHRICQFLGLTLADVILDNQTSAPAAGAAVLDSGAAGPETVQEFLDRHVPRAGGVLASIDRALPQQTVADLLGLTLEQTRIVLDELAVRGSSVGWDVFTVHRDVGVRAAPPRDGDRQRRTGSDGDLIAAALRRDLARRGLTQTRANLVHSVLAGTKTKALTNDDRVQTGALVNAGILVRNRSGGAELSPVAAYSLLFTDDPPTTGSADLGAAR